MTHRRPSPATLHRQQVLAAAGPRVLFGVGMGGTLGSLGAEGLAAAAAAAAAANDDGPAAREAKLMQLQLLDHRQSLKAIQSREAKIALKRELLPLYDGWIAGVLAGGAGEPDEVFTTIMIWRIDVGLFVEAVPMIQYALRWRLALPERINRTLATFVTEEIAEAALKAFAQGGDVAAAFPAGVLAAIEDLVDDEDPGLREDMPDEVRAKLQKAIGKAILRDGEDDRTRQEQALKRFLRALELDEGAGVKKDVDQLQRKLNKPAPPPADASTAEAEREQKIARMAASAAAGAVALGQALEAIQNSSAPEGEG